LDGSNAGYWVNLGNAWRAVGDLSAAERAYRQASTLDPASPDASNGLGVLLVQANRPIEAVALFERAVASRPDFFEAWLNLGIANQEAGRPDAAREAYRRVLEAPPAFARERRAARELLRALRPAP
jgi:Tfp pilus assembly protein PilF